MATTDEDDILDITPPAHIPGVLFAAMVDALMPEFRPLSTTEKSARRRAQRAAVVSLETTLAFYEKVAASEEATDGE